MKGRRGPLKDEEIFTTRSRARNSVRAKIVRQGMLCRFNRAVVQWCPEKCGCKRWWVYVIIGVIDRVSKVVVPLGRRLICWFGWIARK